MGRVVFYAEIERPLDVRMRRRVQLILLLIRRCLAESGDASDFGGDCMGAIETFMYGAPLRGSHYSSEDVDNVRLDLLEQPTQLTADNHPSIGFGLPFNSDVAQLARQLNSDLTCVTALRIGCCGSPQFHNPWCGHWLRGAVRSTCRTCLSAFAGDEFKRPLLQGRFTVWRPRLRASPAIAARGSAFAPDQHPGDQCRSCAYPRCDVCGCESFANDHGWHAAHCRTVQVALAVAAHLGHDPLVLIVAGFLYYSHPDEYITCAVFDVWRRTPSQPGEMRCGLLTAEVRRDDQTPLARIAEWAQETFQTVGCCGLDFAHRNDCPAWLSGRAHRVCCTCGVSIAFDERRGCQGSGWQIQCSACEAYRGCLCTFSCVWPVQLTRTSSSSSSSSSQRAGIPLDSLAPERQQQPQPRRQATAFDLLRAGADAIAGVDTHVYMDAPTEAEEMQIRVAAFRSAKRICIAPERPAPLVSTSAHESSSSSSFSLSSSSSSSSSASSSSSSSFSSFSSSSSSSSAPSSSPPSSSSSSSSALSSSASPPPSSSHSLAPPSAPPLPCPVGEKGGDEKKDADEPAWGEEDAGDWGDDRLVRLDEAGEEAAEATDATREPDDAEAADFKSQLNIATMRMVQRKLNDNLSDREWGLWRGSGGGY